MRLATQIFVLLLWLLDALWTKITRASERLVVENFCQPLTRLRTYTSGVPP